MRDLPKTLKEKIYYISCRQTAISKNKTGDIFCSRCFQASYGEVSECCGMPTINRGEALVHIEEIRAKWKNQ
jgi:hypothetical protein